jgi:(2Fe-2S) ferredoxin
MGHSIDVQVPFGFVGEFLGFMSGKGHQPRAIKLRWVNQEVVVKIAKYIRDDQTLSDWIPGMQVQVWGTQRFCEKRSQLKFKAHRLAPCYSPQEPAAPPVTATPDIATASATTASATTASAAKSAAKSAKLATTQPIVLKVCTESGCMKRGGREICKMLDREVHHGSQTQPMTVKGTGCMGKCKSGPHLVVMPEKVTYSHLKSRDIPDILMRHVK